jgi:hypothetical protein
LEGFSASNIVSKEKFSDFDSAPIMHVMLFREKYDHASLRGDNGMCRAPEHLSRDISTRLRWGEGFPAELPSMSLIYQRFLQVKPSQAVALRSPFLSDRYSRMLSQNVAGTEWLSRSDSEGRALDCGTLWWHLTTFRLSMFVM